MPTRVANSKEAQRVGPLNVDGVLQIQVDLSDVGTITAIQVDEAAMDAALDLGDGSTAVTIPTGSITPATPTLSSNVATFTVFQKSGQTLRPNKDYHVTLHYQTSVYSSSVTCVFQVVSDR